MDKRNAEKIFREELMAIARLEEEETARLLGCLPEQEAAKRLIEGSLHYASSVVERYTAQGGDYMDMMQEAGIALTILVNSLSKPVSVNDFADYRKKAVGAAIDDYMRELNESKAFSEEITAKINVLNVVVTKLAEELEREPTAEEIARFMKISTDEVQFLSRMAMNAIMADREAAAEAADGEAGDGNG